MNSNESLKPVINKIQDAQDDLKLNIHAVHFTGLLIVTQPNGCHGSQITVQV